MIRQEQHKLYYSKNPSEDISNALNHHDFEVRRAALFHKDVEPHHIMTGLNHEHEWTKYDAASVMSRRPHLQTDENLNKALSDPDDGVRLPASYSANLSEKHLKKMALDDNMNVALNAIRHKNTTKAVLLKSLRHPMEYIASSAQKRLETIK